MLFYYLLFIFDHCHLKNNWNNEQYNKKNLPGALENLTILYAVLFYCLSC